MRCQGLRLLGGPEAGRKSSSASPELFPEANRRSQSNADPYRITGIIMETYVPADFVYREVRQANRDAGSSATSQNKQQPVGAVGPLLQMLRCWGCSRFQKACGSRRWGCNFWHI